MPGTIADKCEEFVDKYGQMVIDMIVQDELDPTEVCGSLMPECSNRPRVTDTRCPWGPAYWCATPFHARTCGTTQHCKVTTSWILHSTKIFPCLLDKIKPSSAIRSKSVSRDSRDITRFIISEHRLEEEEHSEIGFYRPKYSQHTHFTSRPKTKCQI